MQPNTPGGQAAPAAVLAICQEPFLLEELERDLRDRLIDPADRDMNLLTLYGWEAGAGPVLEFLQTLPFLGTHRLLVIREIQKFDDWKGLEGYLKDPNPSSTLLMTSSELKKTSAQYRSLSKLSQVSEPKRPYGRALVDWVAERFLRHGKSIDTRLSELLVQTAREDLGILATEIEKVALCSGDRDVIEEEDLAVSVAGGAEAVFGFLDSLADGDGAKALSSLRTLLENDNPPEYILHMMAWQYRQLVRGKELVLSGMSPDQAALKLGKKIPVFRQKFARQLGRADRERLLTAVGALAQCDLALKRGKAPAALLLDRLVLELLAG